MNKNRGVFLKKCLKNNKGFTLIELIVSIAIFVLMTGLLIAKYGTFNQNVLFTNLSYDIALVVRTAQSYGLSVKGDGSASTDFRYLYGVHFSKSKTDDAYKIVTLYRKPLGGNITYDADSGGESSKVTEYNIKRNSYVSGLCVGDTDNPCQTIVDTLDIGFIRPDPTAIIDSNVVAAVIVPTSSGVSVIGADAAKITLSNSSGDERSIVVYKNGQVSVLQ